MKIIYYELLKVWKKSVITVMVIILLLCNSALFIYSEWSKHSHLISNKQAYEELEKQYQVLNNAEGFKKAEAKFKELEYFLQLSSESSSNERDPIWKELMDQKKEDNPELTERYYSSMYRDDPELLRRDFLLSEELFRQYQDIDDYRKYVNELEIKSSEMLSVSIFYKEDSYAQRNIYKTLEDFKPWKNRLLQIGLEYGVVSATSFIPADLSMLIVVFMLAIYIFHQEKDAGFLRLIRSARFGRFSTASAKLFVTCLLTIVSSLLIYGSILFIANYIYGFGKLERYIQSMPSFINAVVDMTVGQYLSIYLLMKILACLLLSMMISLLFICFSRPSTVFIGVLLLIGGSYSFYTGIHPNSYANSLKYLNPVAFMDVFHLFGEYRNINIWGYPFLKTSLTFIIGGVLLVLFLICALIAYTYHSSISLAIPWSKLISPIRTWWFRIRQSNKLFHHEWYKLLISNKGWFVLLLALVICFQMIQSGQRSFTKSEAIYNQYMVKLKGPLDSIKINFMKEERNRFNNLSQEYTTWLNRYHSGEITLKQYNKKRTELEDFADKENIFRTYVERQYMDLLRMQELTGITGSFINEITSDELFNRQSRDILIGVIYFSLFCLLLSTLFTQDYRNDGFILLKATRYGRGRLFLHKTIISYILAITLIIILNIPVYINLLRYYPDLDWSAPIQSIKLFSETELTLTILEFVIIRGILQCIGCIALVHISQLLSVIIRKQALSIMLQAAVFIVPLAVIFIGYDDLIPYTFSAIFLLSSIMNSGTAYLNIALYFSILLLISLGALVVSWRNTNGLTMRKGGFQWNFPFSA